MKTINEILGEYTTGEKDLAETNAAQRDAETPFHLEPEKNALTDDDLRETTVGYYPEQANGWVGAAGHQHQDAGQGICHEREAGLRRQRGTARWQCQ